MKGFTLIEILVVTSIISLLSSTIYSSTSEIKAKAKVTAIQVADRQRNIALSDSVLSTVTFNGAQGSSEVSDSSGANNTYSGLNGGNIILSTDVPVDNDNYLGMSSNGQNNLNTNYSAYFDNSPIVLNSGSNIIGKVLKSHTISLWAKFEGANKGGALININGLATDYSDAGICINCPEVMLEEELFPLTINNIIKNIIPTAYASNPQFPTEGVRYTNVGPASLTRVVDNPIIRYPYESNKQIPNFEPGVGIWHHYAYSYDENTKNLIFYIDGKKYSEVSRSGYVENTLGIYSAARTVENIIIGPKPFMGKIDDIAIYESVQPISFIRNTYLSGLPKYSNSITKR